MWQQQMAGNGRLLGTQGRRGFWQHKNLTEVSTRILATKRVVLNVVMSEFEVVGNIYENYDLLEVIK